MKREDKKVMAVILTLAALLIIVPLIVLKGAEFSGSDDAASQVAEEMADGYEPWFHPVMETVIGGEIPREVESLIFCIQTGIGVGVFAFYMGRFVERRKWENMEKTLKKNIEKKH